MQFDGALCLTGSAERRDRKTSWPARAPRWRRSLQCSTAQRDQHSHRGERGTGDTQQVQQLEATVETLRGESSIQVHELEGMQDQMLGDLETRSRRIRELETNLRSSEEECRLARESAASLQARLNAVMQRKQQEAETLRSHSLRMPSHRSPSTRKALSH